MQKMHNSPIDLETKRERDAFLAGCDAGFETMRKAVLGKILTVTGEAIMRGEGRIVAVLENLATDIEQSWRNP